MEANEKTLTLFTTRIRQLILQFKDMKKENADAYTIHNMYGYANGKTPDRNVKTIVYDVLYNGLSVTDEPILYFYAPALTYSAWHESQIFVMEIGGHRFFKERV